MILLLAAFACWVSGAASPLCLPGTARPAAYACAAGCALAFAAALACLLSGTGSAFRTGEDFLPGGALALGLDGLSAFFLAPAMLLCGLAAVYGSAYDRAGSGGTALNLLVACLALSLAARNAVPFLLAWEGMALASFFLVAHGRARAEVREAAWTYLVFAHLGAFFVAALFLWLGESCGSLDFAAFARGIPASAAGPAFLLALAGFGAKAGLLPLHVWLPEAHPVAPSHVSAVLSGAMIKCGIYGLARTLGWLGAPPAWWGWALLVLGAATALYGILFALGQSDLKRMLAYSSVENVGVIALGFGLGLLGVSHEAPILAALGFGGGLLHALNHALFKGLLFLAAGAVLHGTGTAAMDRLGGLLRRMPLTGAAFLAGAAALAALPPLNGFVGEFLLFGGAFSAVRLDAAVAVPSLLAIAVLALTGGLAAACLLRACGAVFLGQSRGAPPADDPPPAMLLPLVLLAAACLALGLACPVALPLVRSALACLPLLPQAETAEALANCTGALVRLAAACGLLTALIAALFWLRATRLAGRTAPPAATWDCGYARPTARMQIGATGFAQPLASLFRPILQPRCAQHRPEGLFPTDAAFSTETPDLGRMRLYAPLLASIDAVLARVRRLQHGRLHLYVLYLALAAAGLLLWKLA